MPQWLLWVLIIVAGAIVLGFFALVFAEMGVKRRRGRFSASRPEPDHAPQARKPARKARGGGNQGGASKSKRKRGR